jgi:HAE1 family hydrophobic/amphiphilic exporter-1
MASTFVAGLCTATFLTIVLVPVQWSLIHSWRQRWQARRGRAESPAA